MEIVLEENNNVREVALVQDDHVAFVTYSRCGESWKHVSGYRIPLKWFFSLHKELLSDYIEYHDNRNQSQLKIFG